MVLDGDDPDSEDLVLLPVEAGLVDLAHAALPDFVEEFVLEGGLLLAEADLLEPVLEFTGAEQLALELALVDLVAVAGDDVEHRVHVCGQFGDVADVDEAALGQVRLAPEEFRSLLDVLFLLPHSRLDELHWTILTSSLRCRFLAMNTSISLGNSNSGRIS